MSALRSQVTFREPFIAPRARVRRRFSDIALYSLGGLSALAVAMYLFVFAA